MTRKHTQIITYNIKMSAPCQQNEIYARRFDLIKIINRKVYSKAMNYLQRINGQIFKQTAKKLN